jgi:hypothetical protein
LLAVNSTPVTGLKIEGSHSHTTDYTYTAMLGSPVALTAPTTAGKLSFSRWVDGSGGLLASQPTYTFTFIGDCTVTAVYEHVGPIDHYYVNDETPDNGVAAGDDANDGLTPQTPMRHLQALLGRYSDLSWGDQVDVSRGPTWRTLLSTGPIPGSCSKARERTSR